MWRFLVALGGFTLLVGLMAVAFGSVIFVSTIGNALISTGAIGFTGGVLILASGFILRELERIRAALVEAARPARPAQRPVEVSLGDAALLAVSEAVTPEPPRRSAPVAPPPEPRPEPKVEAAPEPEPAPVSPPEPAPPAAPVDIPAPRLRAPSFSDRLRRPLPTLTPERQDGEPAAQQAAPSAPQPEAPAVTERRGRILGRHGDAELAPPIPRPRSLLNRMALSRPVPERVEPPAPAAPQGEPEPAPDHAPAPEVAAEPHAPHDAPAHEPAPAHHAEEAHEPAPAPEAPPAHEAPAYEPPSHEASPHQALSHEPAPEPQEPAHEPIPEPVEPPRPAPRSFGAPAGRPEPVVLKSGIVGGMAYTLYSDGSIQAELPDGIVRFASLQELRDHVARAHPPA